MLYAAAADLVVVAHVAFIAFVLFGGYAAWRWPRLLWAQVPAVVVTAVLFSFGADCPLTNLEKFLREQAGQPVYGGGFVAHYLVPGVPGSYRAVVLPVVVALLSAGAYLGCLTRWQRRRHRVTNAAPTNRTVMASGRR
jgi:hypothetical protein